MQSDNTDQNPRWDSRFLYEPSSDSGENIHSYSQQSFAPVSSSVPSSDPAPLEEESASSIKRLELEASPEIAQTLLNDIKKWHQEGWCEFVDMSPTKEGGYIQLSWHGINKIACLQEVALWARGLFLRPGTTDQVSHLCHHPPCRIPSHVTVESAAANNARKNCLVWVRCPHHPDKVIIVCPHDPICIKFAEGFTDMEDLRLRGSC